MEAPHDATKSKSDIMNFSGSASDMASAMAAAGIVVPEAKEAALKVAAAAPSAPEKCDDPTCTTDHSHGGHDHGHAHGHDHKEGKAGKDSHDHGHANGHDHKEGKAGKDGHDHGHAHGHDHKEGKAGHHASHSGGGHGHTHEHMDHPGEFKARETATGPMRSKASLEERAFTVGIGGPVGSGKTALLLQLCRQMRNGPVSIAAVTNDIFTREDCEFLTKHEALEPSRIRAVETGGCPHAAIREDVSANLQACEDLTAQHKAKIVFVESGGDNLAANFSRELADFTLYVIDVAGGDKVPRKGGPGITQSDVLVVNKTDLAEAVGSDLGIMKRDALAMRGVDGPTIFAQVKHGVGVPEIIGHITSAFDAATKAAMATGDSHSHGHGHGHEEHGAATKKARVE